MRSLRTPVRTRPKRRASKWGALIFLLVIVLFLFSGGPVRAFAASAEEDAAMEELEEKIEELLSSLDTEELQKYLDSLSDFEGTSVKEKILSMITGDFALDYSSFSEAIVSLIMEEWQTFLAAFAVILAVALLCGVLNSVKNGFLHSTMSDIINFVGYISVGAVVLSCLLGVINGGFAAGTPIKKQNGVVLSLLL